MTAIWTAFSPYRPRPANPVDDRSGTFTLHTVSVTLLVSNISDPTNAATNRRFHR
jgi:hypothetical protein